MTSPRFSDIMNARDKRVVLIIEGSAALRSFGREVLKSNFHVVETNNGKEGLALARQMHPDVVLCDILVPSVGGLEICRELKSDAATSHMSVVLLGPECSSDQEMAVLHAGADDYLLRPFDNKVLGLKINNLIRSRDALFGQYVYKMAARPDPDDLDSGLLEKLRELVVEHISDPDFGVQEMAFQSGVSVSVLYRKLRSLTGITVNEFVKQIRMKKAMQLLKAGTYHVNEVATAVGYEDSKYFSREFRRTFGKTPTEVKRRKID